ncbi:hypothetical protein Hamer_G001163 [Homarus americanus]|uniref:Uncharacterized protein n=1 Tax=Homarus americanus TaxID=6706 RepID=A0A8J5TIM4_HOMAM|nr:hypothetical protein Hamer_G001163 [Homarus americanus]
MGEEGLRRRQGRWGRRARYNEGNKWKVTKATKGIPTDEEEAKGTPSVVKSSPSSLPTQETSIYTFIDLKVLSLLLPHLCWYLKRRRPGDEAKRDGDVDGGGIGTTAPGGGALYPDHLPEVLQTV